MKRLDGTVCKDRYTKILVQRIGRNDIAVVKHKAIDLVVAQDLKNKNIKAIINCEKTIDEQHALDGVKYLLDNGIDIYDVYDTFFFNMVNEKDYICLDNNKVFINNIYYTYCTPVTKIEIDAAVENKDERQAYKKLLFVKNTMGFMDTELKYFLREKDIPKLDVNIKGREVVIVSRGRGYREDLKAIREFITCRKPILISVDGGADAVDDTGFKSDIIVGDMDSVSDRSLLNCREILVHTYSSGYAPGLKRVEARGLKYKLLKLKGTSEDAAIYMAQLKGASAIYLIGSHTCYEEFIEKERPGMGSTVLLRILQGSRIVDLKGISNVIIHNNRDNMKIAVTFLFTIIIAITFISYDSIFELAKNSLRVLFNRR